MQEKEPVLLIHLQLGLGSKADKYKYIISKPNKIPPSIPSCYDPTAICVW
jgi:hypothetical protein